MKVYIIMSGEYSDCCIDAVSLNEEEAERVCATLNKKKTDDYCWIEEYDTEKIKIDTSREIKRKFYMESDYKTGEVLHFEKLGAFFDGNDEILFDEEYGKPIIKATVILSRETTDEKAKKIMFDRISKFKAEREEL